MVLEKSEKIAENSRTPKYLQVVNLFLEEIEMVNLRLGNEFHP